VTTREASIAIHGHELTQAQSAAVRIAVSGFLSELRGGYAKELGAIGPLYVARLEEVEALLLGYRP
jgi:hypothetical protein